MRKRTFVLIFACAAALLAVAVPTWAAGRPYTTRVAFAPVDARGALVPGIVVGVTFTRATCQPGSDVTEGGYRCFADDAVLDGCWRYRAGVVCDLDPTAKQVARVVTATGLTAADQGPTGGRLALRLRGGRVCRAYAGAHDIAFGKAVTYWCAGNLAVVGGLHRGPHWLRADLAQYTGHGFQRRGTQLVGVEYVAVPSVPGRLTARL